MRTRPLAFAIWLLACAFAALTGIPVLSADGGDDRQVARSDGDAGQAAEDLTLEFVPNGYIIPTGIDAHVTVTKSGNPVNGAEIILVLWEGPHAPFDATAKTGPDGTVILPIPGDGVLGTDSGWVAITNSAEARWEPGRARPQTSEDFVLLWAINLYGWYTGNWLGASFCLYMLGYVDVPEPGRQAASLRQYRDEVLSRTDRGRFYTRLYYEHGAEVVHLALTHPHIGAALTDALARYGPLIGQLGASRRAEITDRDLSEVKGIIDAIRAHASDRLRGTLDRLGNDLEDARALEELGFALVERR